MVDCFEIMINIFKLEEAARNMKLKHQKLGSSSKNTVRSANIYKWVKAGPHATASPVLEAPHWMTASQS